MNDNKPRRIPDIYENATWRNTTPLDAGLGEIGIGFDADGGVVRLRLRDECARHLCESLTAYLGRSHSTASGGVPRVDVSIPDE